MTVPLVAAGAGLLGDVIGGLFGKSGQEEANAANAALADKQMAFQERMSSTAWQRATADMKAAGINPMLAFSQGPASSPGGSMATMQNPNAPLASAIEGGVSSAMGAMTQAKNLELMEAQKQLTVQQAGKAYWDRAGAQQLYGEGEPGVTARPGVPSRTLFQAQKLADIAVTRAQSSSAEALARIAQRDATQETSLFGRGLNWVRRFRESVFGGGNAASAAAQAAAAASRLGGVP